MSISVITKLFFTMHAWNNDKNFNSAEFKCTTVNFEAKYSAKADTYKGVFYIIANKKFNV